MKSAHSAPHPERPSAGSRRQRARRGGEEGVQPDEPGHGNRPSAKLGEQEVAGQARMVPGRPGDPEHSAQGPRGPSRFAARPEGVEPPTF